MKLYSYSGELITFVEAKRLKTKCAAAGILIGAVFFFGFITLNEFIGKVFEPRLVKTLTAENNILRQQLGLMSPRLSSLEMQMGLLYELDDNLHMLLPNHTIVVDTVSRFTHASKDSISNL